jgi:hypothetical protein
MTLAHALARFVAAYHARPDLVAEQHDWTRAIRLVASDSGESILLHVEGGRAAAWEPASAGGDVIITAQAATLCDVLELRRGPNEPYLFGELVVRGTEADFFRLDYITSRLCPS